MTAKTTKTSAFVSEASAKSSGLSPNRSEPQAIEGSVGMAPRL